MRKLAYCTLVGIFISFSVISSGQKCVDKFIDKNLKTEGAIALSLPGWLVRATGRAVSKFSEEEESKYWKLTDYIRHFRFLVIDDKNPVNQQSLENMLQVLATEENYDEYFTIRDKDSNVNIYAKEKKGKITNLVFLVNDSKSFVILRLKTKIPLNYFSELNYKLIESSHKKDTSNSIPLGNRSFVANQGAFIK